MRFHALIEEWPSQSVVFFRELPGCTITAQTTAAAIGAASAAIERYLRWLKKNDIPLEEDGSPTSIVVQERLSSLGNNRGPLFAADRTGPSDLEIDFALNVAATTRALIIEVATNVPVNLHTQVPKPGSWSLLQHMQYILATDNWYASLLQEHPEPEKPASAATVEEITFKIFDEAMDYEMAMRELSPAQREQVFVHDGESWTAAKVLRRYTYHLHRHLAVIEAIEKQFAQQ